MKVSIPSAAALALFHLVSALPAPTAVPGELDIIKYGRDMNDAHVLRPRQSGVVSVSVPQTPASTSRSAAPSSSTSEAPEPPTCASLYTFGSIPKLTNFLHFQPQPRAQHPHPHHLPLPRRHRRLNHPGPPRPARPPPHPRYPSSSVHRLARLE
jgi:hypothetical protein